MHQNSRKTNYSMYYTIEHLHENTPVMYVYGLRTIYLTLQAFLAK